MILEIDSDKSILININEADALGYNIRICIMATYAVAPFEVAWLKCTTDFCGFSTLKSVYVEC